MKVDDKQLLTFLKEDLKEAGTTVEHDDDLRHREREQELRHRDLEFERELARRDAEIEELKIDRALKERVSRFVFDLLLAETGIVLLVLFLQGFGVSGFHLNNTTLNIFLPATIVQISAMAVIITKYLFSEKKH